LLIEKKTRAAQVMVKTETNQKNLMYNTLEAYIKYIYKSSSTSIFKECQQQQEQQKRKKTSTLMGETCVYLYLMAIFGLIYHDTQNAIP